MGSPCSCVRRIDSVQLASMAAVSSKLRQESTTSESPGVNEALVRELSAYLQTNRDEMNKKLVQLYEHTIEKPQAALSSIQLKLCKMTDRDWTHFSAFVGFCKSSPQLLIWKTSLTSRGFRDVCKALAFFSRLEVLTLEDLGLGHHLLSQLVEGLRKLNFLRSVNFGVNEIGPDDAEALAEGLARVSTLREVNLDENAVGDRGCVAICKHLGTLESLTFLSLRYNSISHIGCLHLISLGLANPALKIFVDGNDIEEREIDKLTRYKPIST